MLETYQTCLFLSMNWIRTSYIVLGFWGKMTMPNAGIMHIAGIYRPLPKSRALSEEPRKTGWSCILSVALVHEDPSVCHNL